MEIDTTKIIGGATSFSGTMINSFVRLATTFFNIGRAIGTAINYGRNKYICSPK